MFEEFAWTTVIFEMRRIHPDAMIPSKKRITDAGYDLYAVEDSIIKAGEIENVSTGIQLSIPPGWFYTIEGRSSLFKYLLYPNRAIIDSTYTGELFVNIHNRGNSDYHIQKHDRIAQIIINKQYNASFNIVEEFSQNYNSRGTNGFGSTGR